MLHDVRISIHPRPEVIARGPKCKLRGTELDTLLFSNEALGQTFSLTFEECYARLERIPRMFIELDGSFVWVSASDENVKWQWDGNLYDRAERLLYIDLHGSSPREAFEEILKALDWPAHQVVVQLAQEGIFLELDEFYRYATALPLRVE